MLATRFRDKGFLLIVLTLLAFGIGSAPACGQDGDESAGMKEMIVKTTEDFDVTGDGSNAAWQQAAWTPLSRNAAVAEHNYTARIKMLYSETGLYILFDGTDSLLTATLDADYLKLWTEDVFEAFFWTDEQHPVYFEYEISPLGFELPLIIPNFDGSFFGWIPWQYEGERLTRKAVSIQGGPQTSGARIEGWRAEVFVPYALLSPLQNVPPTPGMRWRANFYRVDYDGQKTTYWSWTPVESSFHEYDRFGTITFE